MRAPLGLSWKRWYAQMLILQVNSFSRIDWSFKTGFESAKPTLLLDFLLADEPAIHHGSSTRHMALMLGVCS
jgi:hypothetical protein